MIKYFGLVVSILCIYLINGCAKESEDVLRSRQGPVVCDTAGMKYSVNVLPIIVANCYSCHANGVIEGGVNLEGYSNLKAQADNGNLIGVITHANGYTPMPDDGGKLSDCEIAIITNWVQAGAPEN